MKLESVQEVVVPVVVQAPDHQLYSAVPSTSGSGQAGSDPQPEEGYYNFSLELLKSFTERFKGQVSIDGLLMLPVKFLNWYFFKTSHYLIIQKLRTFL